MAVDVLVAHMEADMAVVAAATVAQKVATGLAETDTGAMVQVKMTAMAAVTEPEPADTAKVAAPGVDTAAELQAETVTEDMAAVADIRNCQREKSRTSVLGCTARLPTINNKHVFVRI